MADPFDDLAGKPALPIALDDIGDEIPQHRCRGVVGTDHMGEIIHEEREKACIVSWCRDPGASGRVLRGMRRTLLLLVPPGDDVVEGAVVFYPGLSCHDGRVADIIEGVNTQSISLAPSAPFHLFRPDP